MSTHLITFSTPAFHYSCTTLIKSARKFGIEHVYAYTGKDFSRTDFYNKHKHITSQNRGAGYWLWKPYYILKHLESISTSDILFYCDSGLDIIYDLDILVKLITANDNGILLFENYQGSGYFNKTNNLDVNAENLYVEINKCKYWTKRDTFIILNMDESEYWDSPQVDASFQVYKKTPESLKFLKEWLSQCCNEQALTDLPNIYGKENFYNFFGHIHDQAIISLLAKKYKLELYRCASQFGNHFKLPEFRGEKEFTLLPYSDFPKLNSQYPQLLNHHRTRFTTFYYRWRYILGQEKRVFLGWFYGLFK